MENNDEGSSSSKKMEGDDGSTSTGNDEMAVKSTKSADVASMDDSKSTSQASSGFPSGFLGEKIDDSGNSSKQTDEDESVEEHRMSGWMQVAALLRKNFITKSRTRASTFLELFSPMLMMLVLALAYQLVEVTSEEARMYSSISIDLPGPWLDVFDAGRMYLSTRTSNELETSRRLETSIHNKTMNFRDLFHDWGQRFVHEETNGTLRQENDDDQAQQDILDAAFTFLDDASLINQNLLSTPVPIPTFSQYVQLSNIFSSFIAVDDLPRLIADSSIGRQWGNLLALGTLHLSPQGSLADDFSDYLSETYPTLVPSSLKIRTHDSEEDALEYINENLNEKTWALIDFEQFALAEEASKFKIRLNYTTLPNTNEITDFVAIGLNTDYQRYYLSGYMTLQRTVNEFAFSKTGTCEEMMDDLSSVWSMPMPTPVYTQNPFFLQVGYLLGLTIVMAFLYPTSRLIKSIVEEKETRMRETLLILGLRGWANWIAWMLTSAVVFSIITASVSLTLSTTVLLYSDPWYIFCFIGLFSSATVGFSFTIAAFFGQAKLASIVGPIALFVTLLPRFIFFGANRFEATTGKMIASLLPATAFAFGADILADYEYAEQGIQEWNASQGDYSFNTTLFFLFVDSIIYNFLGWYLEQIVPNQYGSAKPFYFLLMPSYWFGSRISASTQANEAEHAAPEPSDDIEFEAHASLDRGVHVLNVVKNYASTKDSPPAINRLTLRMHESQITTLLGHNGAGKTSTVSVLTGLFPPTSGDCFILGKSIVAEKQQARASIGICPQHNILFEFLTVYEHLAFFMRLKGVKPDADTIHARATEVGLTEYLHTASVALSGGNKRKLSVAIALAGNPRFLVLDEPTSAMDPHSRRSIWELLRSKRKGRVILLTTHFMDEAEILSDKIAVLQEGRLRCSGSTLFLKDRFGLGYNLTVVLKSQGMLQDDEEAVRKRLPQPETMELPYHAMGLKVLAFLQEWIQQTRLVRTAGRELTFRFPQHQEENFAKVFHALEESSASLGIDGYGIKDTSLEEIFLHLAEGSETVTEIEAQTELPSHKYTSARIREEDLLPITLSQQVGLLYRKRLVVQRRDKMGAVFALALPVLVMALVLLILTLEPLFSGGAIELSPKLYADLTQSDGRVVFSSGETDTATRIQALVGNGTGFSSSLSGFQLDTFSGIDSSAVLSAHLLKSLSTNGSPSSFAAFQLDDTISATARIDLSSVSTYVDNFSSPGIRNVRIVEEQHFNITVATVSTLFFELAPVSPSSQVNVSLLHQISTDSLNSIFGDNSTLSSEEWSESVAILVDEIVQEIPLQAIVNNAVRLIFYLFVGTETGETVSWDPVEYNFTETNLGISDFLDEQASFDRNVLAETLVDLAMAIDSSVGLSLDRAAVLLSFRRAIKKLEDTLQGFEVDVDVSRLLDSIIVLAIQSIDLTTTAYLETSSEDSISALNVFEWLSVYLGGSEETLDGFLNLNLSAIDVDLNNLSIEVKDFEITTGRDSFEITSFVTPRITDETLEAMLLIRNITWQYRSSASVLHNTTSPHAVAVFNQAYAEHLYSLCSERPRSRLVSVNDPLPLTTQQSIEIRTILSVLAALFLLIPYCYIPGAFVVFVVKERISKSKHLQLVSGVNMTAYWVATYLWDLTLFALLSVAVMAILLVYGSESAVVFVGDYRSFLASALLTFGYGVSILPFSYLFARNFRNASTAQISVIVLIFVTGFVAVNAYFIMTTIESTQNVAEGLRPVFRLWPAFNVGEGFIGLATAYFEREILSTGKGSLDWDTTGKSIALLYGLGPFYFTCLLMLEYSQDGGSGGALGRLLRDFRAKWDSMVLRRHGIVHENGQLLLEDGLDDDDVDEDVVQEASRVATLPNLYKSTPVFLEGIWKVFPPSTNRLLKCCMSSKKGLGPRRAVRGLSLAVQEGEIFGLLGSNGAGKTTTVSILTGDIPVTAGEAYVAGNSMHRTVASGVVKARKKIGLCPQIDPLIDLMTGRETLRMFGNLRGIGKDRIESFVDALLEQLTLTPHADKPAGTYSGGNKRKLSLGIASMVGNGGVLLIDECSTGLDPYARKKLWSLIEQLSKRRSVVLTTHSMEEAEALCTRVGIMTNGKFAALGSVQHLKSKFVDGYSIEVNCHTHASAEIVETVTATVLDQVVPGSVLLESHGRFLRFGVSKMSSQSLGTMFQQMQFLKNANSDVDTYSVSQCSLEQVFIGLVQNSIADDTSSSEIQI